MYVFLFVYVGKTSVNNHALQCALSASPLCLLTYRFVDLTFDQDVLCQAAMPVDVVVQKLRIFHALQQDTAGLARGKGVQYVAEGAALVAVGGGGIGADTVSGNVGERQGGTEGGGAAAEDDKTRKFFEFYFF